MVHVGFAESVEAAITGAITYTTPIAKTITLFYQSIFPRVGDLTTVSSLLVVKRSLFMFIFLWVFATTFIISYLSIHNYLGGEDAFSGIIFNLVFLGLSVYLLHNSYSHKEKKHSILFSILILFIIISIVLMMIM
ncbi:hypothetical protein CFK37_09285 [Virgibacillus phasianinus]|uniref:Uncharacterized protein n=2 Tax=Virgibacillus phasianinus TaxID=2017483 RepID=A0A220U2S4_9BACI|nr:hypothetical protein CFK37_09285 [Virgibacillus phasianinus]